METTIENQTTPPEPESVAGGSFSQPAGSVGCVCEWEDDEGKCTQPAIYRTHWHMLMCRGHGSIVMVNHGIDYLVDLQDWEIESFNRQNSDSPTTR